MFSIVRGFLLLLLPLPLLSQAKAPLHAPPRKIQVADGIYLFITPPYSDVGLDGNSVVILSDQGVLVFDANGTPAAATAVLGEIRKLTPKPVRYLVYSHWHWDHWYGAEVYRKAFPGIQIISHEKTRELMMGPALAFNQPGLDTQLPEHIDYMAKLAADAAAKDPKSDAAAKLQRHVNEDRYFLAQKRGVQHTFANLTFNDSLIIRLGQREIHVLHYDRAVTPGDAFLYLPNEKVLITGDLLVNPITFALGCYPTGWVNTLERMEALDADVIVPGHGEPLKDKTLLRTDLALFRELIRRGADAKARGLDVEKARAEIEGQDSVRALQAAITGNDENRNQLFDIYTVDWFLHRVYQELEGPLGDEIAPIPVHGG
jgi:glyoxylase-like metal-dependent hydrolase (beta-lactamase superfamily II)